MIDLCYKGNYPKGRAFTLREQVVPTDKIIREHNIINGVALL